MWRDEMQPWLFARDSASIPELLRNLHYERHPRLWYIILFGLSRLTNNPAAMQAANFLMIGLAIGLFVRNCPIPFYLKAFTSFGYLFVYEWGTLSRNYALGVLLCFAFCVRFPKRTKGYLELAIILFLATQSNPCAAILAASLGGLLVFEACFDPSIRNRIKARKMDTVLSASLVIGGCFLTLWTLIPQPDADPAARYLPPPDALSDAFRSAFVAIWDGFVPISLAPALVGDSLLGNVGVRFVLGMILLPVTVAFFRRSRLILWTYLCGGSLLLLFAFDKAGNSLRHAGHFFLWFIICLWLAYYFPDSKSPPVSRGFVLSHAQRWFLCAFLLIDVFGSGYFSVLGYTHDYSCGKAVAAYIEQHYRKGLPILVYPDEKGVPVAGYLRERMYYPDTHRWGSFVIEDNKRQTHWSDDQKMKGINDFAAQGYHDFLVLQDWPLTMENQRFEVTNFGSLHEEASFHPAMEGDEIYWLYRYRTGNPPAITVKPFSPP